MVMKWTQEMDRRLLYVTWKTTSTSVSAIAENWASIYSFEEEQPTPKAIGRRLSKLTEQVAGPKNRAPTTSSKPAAVDPKTSLKDKGSNAGCTPSTSFGKRTFSERDRAWEHDDDDDDDEETLPVTPRTRRTPLSQRSRRPTPSVSKYYAISDDEGAGKSKTCGPSIKDEDPTDDDDPVVTGSGKTRAGGTPRFTNASFNNWTPSKKAKKYQATVENVSNGSGSETYF